MDWHKITDNKALKYSLAGFTTAVCAGFFFYLSRPVFTEFGDSFAFREFKQYGVVGTYRKHYHHFFDTISNLATADSRHESLMKELASLQKELEVANEKNTEIDGRKETQEIASRIKAEAGSAVARVPDDIEYTIPAYLLPNQLMVLGMEYFRTHDYEKSAVIFHSLVHLKDEAGYQRSENYLMSAISWYKLKHYEMAADNLKMAQNHAEPGSVLYRESLLWQAMLEHSLGNKNQEQKVLTKLISLYPQSPEVAMVNKQMNPTARMPAAASEKEKPKDEKTDE